VTEQPTPAPTSSPPGGQPSPPAAPSGPHRPLWRRFGRAAWTTGRVTVAVVVALVAAAFVSVFAIDLGPSLRARAEHEGSRLLRRPLHIGRLSVRLLSGTFVVEDLVIEGLTPEATPFLRARSIELDMPWWSIVTGELVIEEVHMVDWDMVIETFPDGRHNFPHIPRPAPSSGPRRFVTTMRQFTGTGGHVRYFDHGLPWSIETGALDLTIARADTYRGHVAFRDGEVRIQAFEPMWTHFQASFTIDGGLLTLDPLTIETDGATTTGTGEVNMGRWPQQHYDLVSDVHFPRMREIFFAGRDFTLSGDGTFRGRFSLDREFRELRGTFTSTEAGLNRFRFGRLRGSLLWDRDELDITDTHADFYGGTLDIAYRMAPLGGGQSEQRLETTYRDVDLRQLTDTLELDGMRLRGRASGTNLLEFPTGRFAERTGGGEIVVDAPEGLAMQGRDLTGLPAAVRREGSLDREAPLGEVPIAGEVVYTYDGTWLRIARGYAATPETYVEFSGETAYGDRSSLPFHVTSRDWQESDRLLAGIMTAVGSPTRPIEVGGTGTFDGTMTGAFRAPRIDGTFRGDDLRAWGVRWGSAAGTLAIENAYVDISDAEVEQDDARMVVNGRFALGFPRRDGGEEIDARIQALGWPVVDLRHAFGIDDYRVDGALSGDFHVYGKYQELYGFGRMTIADGTAYGEPFDTATASLRFEGDGVRLDAIEIRKDVGRVTGAAHVAWAGTYSFAVDGSGIPVETVRALTFEGVPLTGTLRFSAGGSGQFSAPRYDVRINVDDLYLADEGIGQVTGRLSIRDQQMFIEQFETASSRLAVSGAGRMRLDESYDADLTFSFANTSLDPYVRVYAPGISPFATMVGSGALHFVGPLADYTALRGDVRFDTLEVRLFDYPIANDGPLRFTMADDQVAIDRLRLVGEGTSIEMAGGATLSSGAISLRLLGDANLGLLQGFLRDVRAGGVAEVQAELQGTMDAPVLSGTALIQDGRLRYGGLPHSVDAINGLARFDTTGVSIDGVTARVGGGPVTFGGRVDFEGLTPTTFNVTAEGFEMRLRYPEGFRSIVDADLALRGPATQPTLSGTVEVRDAVLSRPIDTTGASMFGGTAEPVSLPAQATQSGLPMRFDIRITAPSTFRIENNATRLVSRADFTLRGTYDRPQLFGRAEIERGEVFFEGKRYTVTRGAIDFSNPTRIEPFFDVEAETRAQVPGQIYRVVFRVSGTPDRFVFDLNSDPPLSPVDILALLFGDVRDPQNAELRALRSPNQTEQDLIAARAARLLASPISANVGRVAEQTLGVDSVQITPSLGDFSSQQSSRLNPGARLTIGKRISERLYLSYTQLLTSSQRDQLILVEFTQSDRLSWIVSQNEDDTYAIDLRVRHVF
jgi:hypothetical protein